MNMEGLEHFDKLVMHGRDMIVCEIQHHQLNTFIITKHGPVWLSA
jgi:hypothetical protein